MRNPRVVVALAIVLLGALAGFLLIGGSSTPSPEPVRGAPLERSDATRIPTADASATGTAPTDRPPATTGASRAQGLHRTDLAPSPPGAHGRLLLDGRPVAAARIEVWRNRKRRGAERLLEVHTDDEGRFAVSSAAAGPVELVVEGKGIPPGFSVRGLRLVAERIVDWGDLHAPLPASLSGRVVDEQDRPVAGVRVYRSHRPGYSTSSFRRDVLDPDSGDADPSVLTDAGGRYAFENLLPGDHFVLAEVPDHRDAEGRCELEPGEHGTVEDLVLRRGLTIRGRVLDAAGGAVAGARVVPVDSLAGANARRAATSGADGGFELRGISPWGAGLEVVAEGFQPHAEARVRKDELVLVQLRPAVVLAGRVEGAGGRAARLELKLAPYRDVPKSMYPALYGELESRPDGTFAIEGLMEGGYEIRAEVPGLGASDLQHVELSARSEPIVLRIGARPTLEVEVFDESGRPVAGARVILDDGPTDFPSLYEKKEELVAKVMRRNWPGQSHPATGAEGRASVPVERGRTHAVGAVHDAYLPEAVLVPSDHRGPVRLTLREAAGIDGCVTDPSGRKRYSLGVACWRLEGGAAGAPENPPTYAVDASGVFAIRGLRPGRYRLAVYRYDRSQDEDAHRSMPELTPLLGGGVDPREHLDIGVSAGATAEVELQVASLGSLTGRVLQGGRPVPGVIVSATSPVEKAGKDEPDTWSLGMVDPDDEDGHRFLPHAITDSGGRYRFLYASPGTWRLHARHPDAAAAMPPIVVRATGFGQELVQDLRLGGAAIRGQLDTEGLTEKQRRSLEVYLFRLAAAARDPFYAPHHGTSQTMGMKAETVGEDGRFELAHLPAGDWVVRVRAGFDEVVWQDVVHTDMDVAVDLGRLARPATVAASVPILLPEPEDEPEQPYFRRGWSAWLRRLVEGTDDGVWVRTLAATDGLELERVPPGSYLVQLFRSYGGFGLGISGEAYGEPRPLRIAADGSTDPATLDFRQ